MSLTFVHNTTFIDSEKKKTYEWLSSLSHDYKLVKKTRKKILTMLVNSRVRVLNNLNSPSAGYWLEIHIINSESDHAFFKMMTISGAL